eukprot:1675922-Ditylum_brightwellii.AAC.1
MGLIVRNDCELQEVEQNLQGAFVRIRIYYIQAIASPMTVTVCALPVASQVTARDELDSCSKQETFSRDGSKVAQIANYYAKTVVMEQCTTLK